MTIAYAAALGLCVCFTNVRAQKTDISIFPTHNIEFVNIQLEDK